MTDIKKERVLRIFRFTQVAERNADATEYQMRKKHPPLPHQGQVSQKHSLFAFPRFKYVSWAIVPGRRISAIFSLLVDGNSLN